MHFCRDAAVLVAQRITEIPAVEVGVAIGLAVCLVFLQRRSTMIVIYLHFVMFPCLLAMNLQLLRSRSGRCGNITMGTSPWFQKSGSRTFCGLEETPLAQRVGGGEGSGETRARGGGGGAGGD